MAATLLERPAESDGAADAADPSVVVSGPDGTEYDVRLPAGATATEVAAIAASVSAVLSAREADPEPSDRPDRVDAWCWSGRLSATGRGAAETSNCGWKNAARADLV